MDLFGPVALSMARGLPRVGGDGPVSSARHEDRPPAPPRRRGWTVIAGNAIVGAIGSPA